MSKLDNLPDVVKKQLEEALAQKEPGLPEYPQRVVDATVDEIQKRLSEEGPVTSTKVVPMDAEDKLRVENISLKEALLRSRADAANAEINRSRQELKAALVKKHGLSSDDKFEINVKDGTVAITRV